VAQPGGVAARFTRKVSVACPAAGSVKKKISESIADSLDESGSTPLTDESLPRVWPRILGKVGGIFAHELEKANLPAIFGPNTLVLAFPIAYNHLVERCQAPDTVTRLEDAIRKVTGRTWNLRFEKTPTPMTDASLAEPSEGDVVPAARPRRDFREDAEKVPLVRRAKEVLGGQVIRADEGFGESVDALPGVAGPEEEDR
jgi:hypothetical protein